MDAFRKAAEGTDRSKVSRSLRFLLSGYRILPAFALLALLALPVIAALTGDLHGTILDPNGAVVEGAKITIRNVATGIVRTATSDSRGEFATLQLEVGIYDVKVEKVGFHTLNSKADIRSGEQTRID